jgi:hypothetical protein
MRNVQRIIVVIVGVFVAFTIPIAAMAHEHRNAGPVSFTVGWLNEPTYAGSVNAVQVELAHGGSPLTGATVQVVVIFGDKNGSQKTSPMDLVPSDETPGEYTAPIVPSRPGTYTFHVTGTGAGTKIDQYFTSSETTFDNVKDPAPDEFPVKDPTSGQLAQRADRTDAKVASVTSRSTLALIAGIAGIVLALAAMVLRRR